MKKDKKTTISFPSELEEKLKLEDDMTIQGFLDKHLMERFGVKLNGWQRKDKQKK